MRERPDLSTWITLGELAAWIGVTRPSVYNAISRGILTSETIYREGDRTWFNPWPTIDQWLANSPNAKIKRPAKDPPRSRFLASVAGDNPSVEGAGKGNTRPGPLTITQQQIENAIVNGSGKTPTKADAETRTAVLKGEMLALKLERERGRLVPIEDVARTVAGEYANARQRLLAVAPRLAPRIALQTDPEVCREMIHAAVVEALEELSADAAYSDQYEPDTSEPEDDGSD